MNKWMAQADTPKEASTVKIEWSVANASFK